MFNPRVQIGDIKPIGSVWPQRSIDKVKRRGNESKPDDEQGNRQSRDDDDDKDGPSFDEYA